jgi:WD40 repeat protein
VETAKEVHRFDKQADEVYSAQFSSDGALAIFAVSAPFWQEVPDPDWTPIMVFDAKTGELKNKVELEGMETICIEAVPDCHSVLSAATDVDHKRKELFEVDLDSGKIMRSFGKVALIKSISFAGESKIFVTSDHNSKVILWDFDGSKVKEYKTTNKHINWIGQSASSLDGSIVAVSGPEIEVLEGNTLKKTQTGLPLINMTNAIIFSPCGKYLATGHGHPVMPGDYYEDCCAIVWDLAEKSEVLKYICEDPVKSLCFSPDSKFLAYGDGGTISLCSIYGGAVIIKYLCFLQER